MCLSQLEVAGQCLLPVCFLPSCHFTKQWLETFKEVHQFLAIWVWNNVEWKVVKYGLITFSFSIELTSVHGIPHHACNISKYGKTWPILVFCTKKKITHLKPIRTLATFSSTEPLALNCYWFYMPNILFCHSSCSKILIDVVSAVGWGIAW